MIETEHEFLSLLEQGADSWNSWREENPTIKPDLSRAYLFEANLAGANLSGVDLSRACLIGANLTGADLSGADLQGAYASSAKLNQANLYQANLEGADLSQANLNHANLTEAIAISTNFNLAALTGACLEGWQINSATQLEDITCKYVYWQREQQQRQPAKGKFKPGELSQLVQAVPQNTRSGQVAQLSTTAIALGSVTTTAAVLTRADNLDAQSPHPSQTIPAFTPPQERKWRLIAAGVLIGISLTAVASTMILRLTQAEAPTAQTDTAQRSPATVANLPALPCQEPPPPALLNRAPDYEYQTGTQYFGPLANGEPTDGRGTMAYSSGNRYDGEYRNGKRNGCGTFTFANGRSYVGQFQDDWFQGQGLWTLENGDRYVGEFRQNKCNGRGTFIFADGSSQSGTWQNGSLVGTNLSCDRTPLEMPRS
ncbi:pentapeptide repeat-containing protein [Trichocoleus sp. FACHB-591]|uniref:pentapeptide repeat-containing protein n=1 Tax=Trichocoleus sp. FACHB-591 TaxID=2692872 RepID=UPI001682D0B9|nr:pentapeptide repeat-containing protein [Trichocoleus sp. FACHB-591]MBD2095440.1 pentapeptide repeat-containing protein [Trichocoleus sp. FACHB-591]